jgi:hypothetical protein
VRDEQPNSNKLSEVECVDCGELIPEKRLEAVGVPVCVYCMKDREANGRGTKRHRMTYRIQSHGEEIEAIEQFVIREE